MEMVNKFTDALDEYLELYLNKENAKNYNKFVGHARGEILESFRKGDTYAPHNFSRGEMGEINRYLKELKEAGPELFEKKETPPPKPNKPVDPQPEIERLKPHNAIPEKPIPNKEPPPFEEKHPLPEKKNSPPKPERKPIETKIPEANPSAPPKPPKEPVQPPKSPTKPETLPDVKTNVIDTKKSSDFLRKNRSKILVGGLGVGLVSSILDKEDDDALSSTGKGLKMAAIGGAIGYAGEHMLKQETVQDLVKGEISEGGKNFLKAENQERRLKANAQKVKVAGSIGLAVVAGATLLDLGMKAKDKSEASSIKRNQEKNIVERDERKKQKQKEQSYGYVDTGELVFELFNARSGHHKMGNAKFN